MTQTTHTSTRITNRTRKKHPGSQEDLPGLTHSLSQTCPMSTTMQLTSRSRSDRTPQLESSPAAELFIDTHANPKKYAASAHPCPHPSSSCISSSAAHAVPWSPQHLRGCNSRPHPAAPHAARCTRSHLQAARAPKPLPSARAPEHADVVARRAFFAHPGRDGTQHTLSFHTTRAGSGCEHATGRDACS